MKHFKVKTGYGKDDFISITEDELQTAMRAQVTGKVAIFKEGTISGNHIMSITPDYNRMMGWNRDYVLTGEDYNQIGKETVEDYRFFIESTRAQALGQTEPKKIESSRTYTTKRIGQVLDTYPHKKS